eukprot:12868954-Ditylum_brightwellii.AAC.1
MPYIPYFAHQNDEIFQAGAHGSVEDLKVTVSGDPRCNTCPHLQKGPCFCAGSTNFCQHPSGISKGDILETYCPLFKSAAPNLTTGLGIIYDDDCPIHVMNAAKIFTTEECVERTFIHIQNI